MAATRSPFWSRRFRLARLSESELLFLALLALAVGAVFAVFHFQGNTADVERWSASALVWLLHRWRDSGLSLGGGDYSHGMVIPVVSAGLVWFRRRALLDAPKRVSWLGLAAVVGSLLLHYIGYKTQQTRLSLFGLIGLCWGVPTYLYGWRVGRLLLFPCAYLLFAVPFNFLEGLSAWLQGVMTACSRVVLHGIGIEVIREGNTLWAPDRVSYGFNVEVRCSGIRSLQALTALTAIYGYLTLPGWWRKWLLFLAAFPLAVIGNMARVVSVVLIAEAFDPRFAGAEYHDWSGFILFAVAIALMVLLGNLLAGARPGIRLQQLRNRWNANASATS